MGRAYMPAQRVEKNVGADAYIGPAVKAADFNRFSANTELCIWADMGIGPYESHI